MCTLLILRRPGHKWPLLLAANRDEIISRPWLPPDNHWPERPYVVAGKDEEAGGTWLGINKQGVGAAILNREGSLGPKDEKRTRGELVLEALDHSDAETAAYYLQAIDCQSYRSFNLIIADNNNGFWLKSTGSGKISSTALPTGLSMITSGELNDKNSPRLDFYFDKFLSAKTPDIDKDNWKTWQSLLASRRKEMESDPNQSMCIVTETGYGTVSSSIIAFPSQELLNAKCKWRFCSGRPDKNPFETVDL